jgi:uncharacterized membrane protein
MARISATLQRTFTVTASIKEVYEFFANPALLKDIMDGVESVDIQEDGTVHWLLEEKVEKGIRFQADYIVRYGCNGTDRVTWEFVEGNMGNSGDVKLITTESGTQIDYTETVEPDLPITAILAKLMKPIVAKELRSDVGGYLERVEKRFNS